VQGIIPILAGIRQILAIITRKVLAGSLDDYF